MELRSYSHLHFIRAIKGGSVNQALNVFRGCPALKFKNLKDVYEIEGNKNFDFPRIIRPKLEFEDLPIDCAGEKIESPSTPTERRRETETKTETLLSDCINDDGKEKSESVDLNSCNITLKQIRERCKAKKRKCSRYAGPSKETIDTFTTGKQDVRDLLSDKDEDDLMETLVSLKSRILKPTKTNRKCKKNSISNSNRDVLSIVTVDKSSTSSSFQSAPSIVKVEEIPIDEAIFKYGESWHVPLDIRLQVAEPICSYCQNTALIDENSFCGCKELGVSAQQEFGEELETPRDCVFNAEMPMLSSKGSEMTNDCVSRTEILTAREEYNTANNCSSQTLMLTFWSHEPEYFVGNEFSYDDMDPPGCESISDIISHREMKSVDIPKEINDQFSDFSSSELKEEPVIGVQDIDDSSGSGSPSKESTSDMDASVCESISDTTSLGEMMTVDIPKDIDDQLSDFSSSELKEKSTVIDVRYNDDFSETVSLSKESTSTYYGPQRFPGIYELPKTSPKDQVQVPDKTSSSTLQHTEHSDRNDSSPSKFELKDDIDHPEPCFEGSLLNECIPFQNSNTFTGQDDCSVDVTDNVVTIKEKHLPPSPSADAARSFSAVFSSCADEPVTSTVAGKCHQPKLVCLPERLLSNRKVISPTSQKRLCKAMESMELDDEQFYKRARKLCYEKQIENKTGRLERANQMKSDGLNLNAKQMILKSKKDMNCSPHKGILKVHSLLKDPQLSLTETSSVTGWDSVQRCSESAISFSQRQMRDIEIIANKLTKELKSMKNLVEETFHSGVYPATFNADEVRIAVQKATKVEESAKRWLSVMARDCNRFCRIMRLSEKDSTSGKKSCKGKRKIVFADEAGGKLCHVKTFENDMAFTGEIIPIVD